MNINWNDVIKSWGYILDWFNAIPGHQWYVIGVSIASVPLVILAVNWRKWRHFKKVGEDMADHVVGFNIVFWGFLTTVTGFVATNGIHFAGLLPYLGKYGPFITGSAPLAYIFAKDTKKWWQDRRNKLPIENSNAPDLAPLVQAVNTPIPAKSFGTQAAGIDVVPPSDLLM